MKKLLLVLSMISVVFLAGCTKNVENNHVPENQMQGVSGQKSKAFSNDQLIEMIKKYRTVCCEYIPEFIEVEEENGDVVTFHLYDLMNDNAVTSDWYYINRTTGKGTNLLEEIVDLNEANDENNILNKSFDERTIIARELMDRKDIYGIENLGFISSEHFVTNSSLRQEDNHYVLALTLASSKLFDKDEIENAYKLAQENGTYDYEGFTFYKDNKALITFDGEDTAPLYEMVESYKSKGYLTNSEKYGLVLFQLTPEEGKKYCAATLQFAGAGGFMITDIERKIEVCLVPSDKMLIVPTNIFEREDGIQGKEISVEDYYKKSLHNETSSDDLIYGFKYDLNHIGDDDGQYAEYVDAVKFEDGMIKVNYKNGGV